MENLINNKPAVNIAETLSDFINDPEKGIVAIENLYGTDIQEEVVEQELAKLLGNCTNIHEKTRFASNLLASNKSRLSAIGEAVIKEILIRYKINSDEAIQSWRQDTPWLAITASANIEGIIDLEEKVAEENLAREDKRVNVASFLQKECFISDFRRYPKDMLIRQYDEYFNPNLNYGIVVFPRSDSTSAYGDYINMLADLEEQAKNINCAIRIFECGNKSDLLKVLIKTKKNYSEKSGRKISFAILGAHGFSSGICLGDDIDPLKDPSKTIMFDDVGDPTMSHIKDFFEKEASIILSSCHTGVEGGVGQLLSRNIEGWIKFMAPDQGSKTEKIILQNFDGDIRADVRFTFANKMIYRNGRLFDR